MNAQKIDVIDKQPDIENQLEQSQGSKKIHAEEVKDAVLFEGMREDHIVVE